MLIQWEIIQIMVGCTADALPVELHAHGHPFSGRGGAVGKRQFGRPGQAQIHAALFVRKHLSVRRLERREKLW